MKMIIALLALVAIAVSAPVDNQSPITIVGETPLDNIGTGDYKYGYQLSNGVTRDEAARFVDAGPEGPVPVVVGSWSWINPDTGMPIITKYEADSNGFRVTGDHLPV